MLVDVGDTPTIRWRQRHPDTDAPVNVGSVTATLIPPGGGAGTDVEVTNPETGLYEACPHITAPGDWLLELVATDPADAASIAIHAVPVGEAAPWSPTLRQVGMHIASRTRAVDTNEPLGTFNEDTYPTGDVTTGLIGQAVAFVAGFTGKPVKEAAYPLCTAAAALWAAYWVEVGFPERSGSVDASVRLRADAVMAMEQAAAVNIAAGGGTTLPPDPDTPVVPDGTITGLSSYSFPCPGEPVIL